MLDQIRRLGDTNEATAKLKELRDAIVSVNLSAGDKLAFGFRWSHLPEGMLDELRQLGDEKERVDKLAAANKGFDEWVKDLDLSIQTIGKTADQVRLFRAELDGVDATKIGEARRLLDQRAALTPAEYRANAPLLRGTAAEVSARMRHEFGGKAGVDLIVNEHKRGNSLLALAVQGIKDLAAKFSAAGDAVVYEID
jgi:hypothetical protein